MGMTPAQRRAAIDRVMREADEMRILEPLRLDRQAETHEARARALACYREGNDTASLPGYVLTENRRREQEHTTAATAARRQAAAIRQRR